MKRLFIFLVIVCINASMQEAFTQTWYDDVADNVTKSVVKNTESKAEVFVTNGASYHLDIITHYKESVNKEITTEAVTLAPGETKIFTVTFEKVMPNFYVYHRSSSIDQHLLGWMLKTKRVPARELSQVLNKGKKVSLTPTSKLKDAYWQTHLKSTTSSSVKSFKSVPLKKKSWWTLRTYEAHYLITDTHVSHVQIKELGLEGKQRYSTNAKAIYERLISKFRLPGKITFSNEAPYEIEYSWKFNSAADTSVTYITSKLKPGEKRTFDVIFRGTTPSFNIYGTSTEAEKDYLRWMYGYTSAEEGVHHFPGHISEPAYKTTNSLVSPVGFVKTVNSKPIGVDLAKFDVEQVDYFRVYPKNRNGVYHYEQRFTDNTPIKGTSKVSSIPASNRLGSELVRLTNAKTKYSDLKSEYHQKKTFVIQNTAPYAVYYAVSFQTTHDQHNTIGWYHLEAGARHKFTRDFYGIRPNLSVYAESAHSEKNLIRLAFGLDQNHHAIRYIQPQPGESKVYRSIKNGSKFNFKTSGGGLSNERDVEHVSFKKIYASGEETTYNIMDIDFPFVYAGASPDQYCERAKMLNASLKRQALFARKIKKLSDIPFLLGLQLIDPNGPSEPGVEVAGLTWNKNIAGGAVPFKKGDILTSINGKPVFSRADVTILLALHATDKTKGIEVPLKFGLVRGEYLLTGGCLYFFNPTFGWPSSDRTSAAFAGIIEAFSLGLDKYFGSWAYLQNKARLKQLHGDTFTAASWIGGWGSIGRLAFRKTVSKQFVKAGVRTRAAGIGTDILLESGEALVWSFNTKSPLVSDSQFKYQLKQDLLYGASFGAAIASFKLFKI